MLTTTHRTGLILAAVTAVVSGFAVFANSYGVRAWSEAADPTTYTTVKNAIAALILVAIGVGMRRAELGDAPVWVAGRRQRLLLGLIAVVGGSIPFVLFFEGLAMASSGQAAFIHKTLVVWVAVMAPMALGERVGWPHAIAIVALVAGQLILVGGVGDVMWSGGETLILAATLLWSVEVVVAKRVLRNVPSMTVGLARMAGGAVVLVAWTAVRGSLDAMWAVGPAEWAWVLLTGGVLAMYVASWYAALARAPAVDVTAILVGGAVITALLRTGVGAAPLADPFGLLLVGFGVTAVLVGQRRWRTA